jgi:hypothetical protein
MNADSPALGHAGTKLRQRLVECYQRGCRLMHVEKNYEYAHTMFAECVLHDPGNLTFVETLLRNLRLIHPRPTRRSILGGRTDQTLKQTIARKELSKAFQIGVELLKANPWDTTTLSALAEACSQFHFNDVELVYLKQALEANPKDVKVNQHCARSLARVGQFDQAIACWHRIEVLHPSDKEPSRMITKLQEEKQKYPGGRPPVAVQAREPIGALVKAHEKVDEAPEPSLSSHQRLERAISENPHAMSNYLALAELLTEAEKFSNAESTLLRGIAECGEHSALKDKLSEVKSLRAQRELAAAQAREAAELKLQRRPIRFPWLEAALGLAAVVLILQLFPGVAAKILPAIDVRRWSRLTWFAANVFLLLLLCAFRFGPDTTKTWRKRKQNRFVKRRSH